MWNWPGTIRVYALHRTRGSRVANSLEGHTSSCVRAFRLNKTMVCNSICLHSIDGANSPPLFLFPFYRLFPFPLSRRRNPLSVQSLVNLLRLPSIIIRLFVCYRLTTSHDPICWPSDSLYDAPPHRTQKTLPKVHQSPF